MFALHYLVPLNDVKEFVNIGGEANLPTWWNSSLLLLVSLLAITAAVLAHRTRLRTSWSVIGLAAAYLSLDEIARIHERLARPVQAAGIQTATYPWLALGALVAVVGAWVLILAGRPLPSSTRHRLGIALACYALGAIGVEAFNGWIRNAGPEVVFSIGMLAEEALEMVACVIAAVAVLDHLLARPDQPDDGAAVQPGLDTNRRTSATSS